MFVFPNPGRDHFQISGIRGQATVAIVNTTGSVMRALRSAAQMTIALGDLAPGLYFVEVTDDHITPSLRLIKD